ncbi:MAG: hypothetical protein LBC97_08440 [Bifidobacteriaceae bacterium]|jgi:hypothetical protein|nr:hypothetical protein [Bifidobacteriaceae bacterium]
MTNLEPIHGISFQDWAEMTRVVATGVPVETVNQAMGIDGAIWDEVNTLWTQRMAEDSTFEMVTLLGQHWQGAIANPKLKPLLTPKSPAAAENIAKLKSDRLFYIELAAARDAAYSQGLDGAQWIADNYGVSLGEFQEIAMDYMAQRTNGQESPEETARYFQYQLEMKTRYEQQFAAEVGGNLADDIDF